MQRIYINRSVDPRTAHAGLTGAAAPNVSGILGAPLNALVAFVTAGEQGALADDSTGKFTLKAANARTGEALFLDVSMEKIGTGAASTYKFSGVLSSDELIAALAEEESIVCKACVSWTEPETDEDKCIDFDFTVYNSASRPDDSLPANTDARWEWLKEAAPEANGFTHDEDAKTLAVEAGVTDHGALSGLADDDHTQYHTDARGDARYTPIAHASDTTNPHGVTKSQVNLGNVTNDAQLKLADLDTDATMAANSDTKIPSQKAVKTHVATAIADLVGAAPAQLDTLNEIAAALDDDASLAANLTAAIGAKEAAQTAVSQAEAEAGTETAIRKWSPLRVKQAIAALAPSGAGVTDHGALSGLADDDHTQYHTDARGDARYTPIAHASDTTNPHGVTKSQVNLGNVTNDAQLKLADLDTDATMAANSDTKIPSQKAVKTHVATAIADLVGAAPAQLDTLNEIAAALDDDASLAANLTAAIGAKEAAQTAVSQAEAEAGTETAIRKWSPLRVKQAIAALATGGGGSPISDPDVAYIRADGDDTTGDGSANAPWKTLQKAVDEGFRVIDAGVGDEADFGGLTFSTGNLTLFIRGCGVTQTKFDQFVFDPAGLFYQLTIHDIGRTSFDLTGGIVARTPGTPGSQGGQVNLFGVHVTGDIQVTGVDGDTEATGGVGGVLVADRGSIVHFVYAGGGGGGAGGESSSSGNGGAGGNAIFFDSVALNNVDVVGGNPGASGGGGTGATGADGSLIVKRATLTSFSGTSAPAVLACCIADVFYANAYP